MGEIKDEFERRKEERRPFYLQWLLNGNFIAGNQYCDIAQTTGELIETLPTMDTEMMSVYNQLAPIVETRLSKLSTVRPGLVVRPMTSDNADITAARVSTRLLKSMQNSVIMKRKSLMADAWMEHNGGVFYKSVWDPRRGRVLGVHKDKRVHEGDLSVTVVPYYELYPSSCYAETLDDCDSVIHAKVYTRDQIKLRWGIDIDGQDMNVFTLEASGISAGGVGYNHSMMQLKSGLLRDSQLVIEYFEKPNDLFEEGRHIIIVGDYCVHYGVMPFKVGEYYRRAYPFVHQRCLYNPGVLWGTSVVERCIPLQRDYNAVKNRINEYLARMAIGNMTAEEGSLVNEEMLENGVPPGAVVFYKPGATPPTWMQPQEIPMTLLQQVDKLEQGFVVISGVSELARSSQAPASISSGAALSVLKEQDDTRLALTAENVRDAHSELGKQWLRLYKQFASEPRVNRVVGDDLDVYAEIWSASDITSDDVVVDTENEMTDTPAQRKQLTLELLQAGLFNDPDTGTMTRETRAHLLEIFRLGNTEAVADLDDLHNAEARRENYHILRGEVPEIEEYDNHTLHMAEHVKFVLSAEFRKLQKKDPESATAFLAHIAKHKEIAVSDSMALQGQGAASMVSNGQQLDTAINADAMNTGDLGAGQ